MGKYTNWHTSENAERLKVAVQASKSISEVCRKLGLADRGGNIATIRNHIVRLGLDTSHHTGQAWNRDNYKRPNQVRHKSSLKAFLIRTHGHYCWSCKLEQWNGLPIPLEMDHIDGNNTNNELDNLRILCCNCHAQTSTFRNKKRTKLP